MARVKPHEARRLGRKMERQMAAFADRPPVKRTVIPANPDDARGDIVSMILNGQPAGMTRWQWLKTLEGRGAAAASTMARWIDKPEQVRPQKHTFDWTLRALGKQSFYGDAE